MPSAMGLINTHVRVRDTKVQLTNSPVSTLGSNVSRLSFSRPFSASVPSRSCLKQKYERLWLFLAVDSLIFEMKARPLTYSMCYLKNVTRKSTLSIINLNDRKKFEFLSEIRFYRYIAITFGHGNIPFERVLANGERSRFGTSSKSGVKEESDPAGTERRRYSRAVDEKYLYATADRIGSRSSCTNTSQSIYRFSLVSCRNHDVYESHTSVCVF